MYPGAGFVGRNWLAVLLAGGWLWFSLAARGDVSCTAYYPGWTQDYMPPASIDFATLSRIVHFALVPNADGSLNRDANDLTPANVADLTSKARAAGKKVLICVGGAATQAGFQAATAPANLDKFINNIVTFMATNGYDGVDLDWEPLEAPDLAQYAQLVTTLRAVMSGRTPHPLLTAAVASQPSYFGANQAAFDQINLMTYDLSGPWSGWVTWFNAPIYDGGYRFPSTGTLLPSTDGMVNDFETNGVAPGKLGIGIAFYGDVWAGGVSLPRQTWTMAPTVTGVAYYAIMDGLYQSNLYHWDTNAQAAYLSIVNPGSANDQFISYDDEHTCQAKVSYARNRRLAGVMIWNLSQGYRATQPAGLRDPLLQAIKQSFAPPRVTNISIEGQDIHFGFTSLPLGLYRVQWTGNLNATAWNTLTNGLSGTGGTLQIIDRGAINQSGRYYRIQTPP